MKYSPINASSQQEKHVDNMEREKFSGNLLNQNKGFGRIEPGLRYLSPFILSCFNHQILIEH